MLNEANRPNAVENKRGDAVNEVPFDINDFDDRGLELPEQLRTPKALIERLQRSAAEYRDDVDVRVVEEEQGDLFADTKSSGSFAPKGLVACPPTEQLWAIVTRAYADVRCDRSIDYVVADPEANILFLQRCWELGAPASPYELNWMLMNSRKDGKLSFLPRAKRFSIAKERLDHFSFAIDIAMRTVQERLYYSEQRDVSIDQVLCDPHLAREFDSYAKRVVPEQGSLECRWTAMALRKARRNCGLEYRLPTLDSRGLLEDVRVNDFPKGSGAFWIYVDDGSLFAGVASNLRVQVDSLVQRLGKYVIPPWNNDVQKVKPRISVCESESYESGEMIRSGLFKRSGSRLNFWNGEFFGSAA